MNLYHKNLAEQMGEYAHITFKNTRRDLDNYWYFLKDIERKLNELAVLSIEFKKVETDKTEQEEPHDSLFKYEISDTNKNIEAILNRLFKVEIKFLYLTPTRQKGEIRVEIKDRSEDSNWLKLGENLGSTTKLFIRPYAYQINKQIKAIERLRDNPLQEHQPLLKLFKSQRHEKLDSIQFNHKDILSNENDWNVLTDKTRDGTLQQRDFVKKALATTDFALLEGPPGSGKTTTIIELIIQLCKLGKRVLLCSSTHVAVDNVLKRVLTKYKAQCEDWVAPVRIAYNESSIRYEEVQEYRLQQLVKTKAGEIKQHLESIDNRNRSESQEKLLESLNEKAYPKFFEEAILEASNLVCGTMIGILQHPMIKNKTAAIGVPFDVMIVDEASKVTFQEFLVPALYAKKWILVGDVKQLSPYVEDEYVEIALNKLLEEEQKTHLETIFPIWRANQDHRKKDLKILLSNSFDRKMAREAFREEVVIFDLDEDFKNPQNDSLALNAADIVLGNNTPRNRNILEKYVYVKATIYDGYLNGEFKRVQHFYDYHHFNHPKKDKSTWSSELAHRLSQYYSFRSSPALGKHLQKDIDFLTPDIELDLPNRRTATTLRKEVDKIKRITMPSILELLQKGIEKPKGYEKLNRIIYDGFPNSAKRLKFVSLSFQHRMNDEIAQVSRTHFYKNKSLNTANTVHERSNPLVTYKPKEGNVIWQTNSAKTKYSKEKKRYLNANDAEANDIMAEINDFLEWAATASINNTDEPFEVAVLCFYRDQEALMRRKLRRLFWQKTRRRYKPSKNFYFGNVKIILCTVDKFQGDEADIVLLSFTKASHRAFYKSPNRLNVALTRARYKLVLFGNHKFFKDKNISTALTDLATTFEVRKSSKRNNSKNYQNSRR